MIYLNSAITNFVRFVRFIEGKKQGRNQFSKDKTTGVGVVGGNFCQSFEQFFNVTNNGICDVQDSVDLLHFDSMKACTVSMQRIHCTPNSQARQLLTWHWMPRV